ncbi:hypothetical protein QBC46DRAFT_391644 [Diplogelasinospora grovesii]|uniref:Protein disulfide-isomerase n=1 Tax=Diplogelasinospora grovesii TaxID=303347 RepID=A0AAN6N3B7_9PEZI|nr:hypothetical protein QBC46DRAFT_391644 [Diplogelasinospora grovesii]
MKMKRVSFLAFAALVAQALAWKHVTDAGLSKALQSNDSYTLVACKEHSQALEPEWIAVERTVKGNKAVSFDCSTKPKLCGALKVSSFPTIRLYHQDGRLDRYRGPRKASSIVGFLRRCLRPTVSQLNADTPAASVLTDDVVFIGDFQPEDASIRARFEATAKKYRDRFTFAVNTGHHRPPSSLACHNNLDGLDHSTDNLASVESLENFVKLCSHPVIPELTRRNEMMYYGTGKSLVHYFVYSDKEREEYVTEMRGIASKFKEYLHFTTTDANEYPDAVEMMGLKPGSRGLSVQHPTTGHVYPYTGKEKITADVVEAFLIAIINGEVQPWTRGGEESAGHDEL